MAVCLTACLPASLLAFLEQSTQGKVELEMKSSAMVGLNIVFVLYCLAISKARHSYPVLNVFFFLLILLYFSSLLLADNSTVPAVVCELKVVAD